MSFRQPGQSTMIRVQGKAFTCECGCNVFIIIRVKEPSQYKCNACGEIYEGEK